MKFHRTIALAMIAAAGAQAAPVAVVVARPVIVVPARVAPPARPAPAPAKAAQPAHATPAPIVVPHVPAMSCTDERRKRSEC